MASCSSCGSSLTGAPRYCSVCGVGVDSGDRIGGDGLFEVIDVSSGVTGGGVSGGGSGDGPGDGPEGGVRWPLVLGAVLVGLLVWVLTRSSDGPGQVE